MECPYEENTYLQSSPENRKIIELQRMSSTDFKKWAIKFRKEVVHAWDNLGIPVLGGQNMDRVVNQFKKLATYNTSGFEDIDELTGKSDCIVNETSVGSACNQFFPTMLKTKDINQKKLGGVSIYSFFAEPQLLEQFISSVRRVVDFGQVSNFSKRLEIDNTSVVEWLRNQQGSKTIAFWLTATDGDDSEAVRISSSDLGQLLNDELISTEQIKGDAGQYHIRTYDPSKKIMDIASAFRICFGPPPPTNFPPLTAKHLYLKFTEEIKDQDQIVVYDPSAGWGGRILGAMACCNERRIHYVGTDPNTDHIMPDLGVTKYEYLADFFNGNVKGQHKNTYEIFRVGSEVIHEDVKFRKYEEEVDFIFTSPPYFAAEGYSDDDTQSFNKFPDYHSWRDGFLRKTLETCVKYLKEDRWICWNIADVNLGADMLPLQNDVKVIGRSLGLEFHGILKMVLRTAPGGMKETQDGIPTTRNFCQIRGKRRKFEPILVFKKPVDHSEWLETINAPENTARRPLFKY